MSDSAYRVAPIFLIRMAGVPFDVVEALATTQTARLARETIARQNEFATARAQVEPLLRQRGHGLSEESFRAWRKTIRSGAPPPVAKEAVSAAFADYRESVARLAAIETDLEILLNAELSAARRKLLEAARTILPPYLIFTSERLRERIAEQLADTGELCSRNKSARAHERHLLLYLQRIATKNDSLSAFGPEGWGTVDGDLRSLTLKPKPGIAARETFLERWTAHGAVAAVNRDPEVWPELSPRLDPHGLIDGNQFVLTNSGRTIPLDKAALDVLRRIDSRTPAHSLGSYDILAKLAEQKIIRWELEVAALEPHAFDVLVADIEAWRDTPVRDRWLDTLRPIAELPRKFAAAEETAARTRIIDEATDRLQQLGASPNTGTRFLYTATNPIGEECFRDCGFSIGEDLVNEVAREAAPWIDLWRDSYAFIASRVSAGLRAILEKAPAKDGVVPLSAFLEICKQLSLPLTGPALVGMSHVAFQEVKAAFRQMIGVRAEAEEVQLSADDCHFVRKNFQYAKFDEYTYPSGDMQISARSVEAVRRGEYDWILAELHPPVALLHHGFYWGCPDKEALGRALASTTFGRPAFHFGFFVSDFTATTAVRIFDAMPELTYFAAPERAKPGWRAIPPAAIDVFVDESTGDVGLRTRASREYLGSFARAWLIPLGFHPFLFGQSQHMPRLRCGKVIVQRRSWTVSLQELPVGNYTGVSRGLVVSVERMRAAKGWPRYVYIRPTEQALRRSGAQGRDKDTKPVFVDFESYLFLEVFHSWLKKAGELEVSEMLPDPDHLLWQEADGRRTFELRTQFVPAE